MSIKKLNTLSNITQNLNGKKLTPLKDYKGVVLKLTSKDKKQIEKYNAEIYYWNKKDMIESTIDKLRELIKQVKQNRLDIQKSNLK